MIIRTIFSAFLLCLLVSCETTEPEKRNFISSYRGLETKASALGNKALVKESDPAALKKYTKVIIDDVKVISARKKKAPAEKNQLNAYKYEAPSRAETEKLAEKFEDILERELGKQFEITKRRGYNTLRVRAALTELQPSNPTLFVVNYLPYAGIAASGVQIATGEAIGGGATTFEAEVVDARSGRQVYAIVDQIKGGKLQFGGLAKWGQTEQAMNGWARRISAGVQKAGATSRTVSTRTLTKPATTAKKKSTPTKKTSSSKPAPKKEGSNAWWLKKSD